MGVVESPSRIRPGGRQSTLETLGVFCLDIRSPHRTGGNKQVRGKPSRSGCCGLLVCLTKSTCERLLGGVAPSVGHLRERHFTAVVLGDVLCTAEVLDEAGANVTDCLRGCVADARELGVIAPIADPGCEFAHRVELLDEHTAGV